jgi:hypothetical protein
MKPLMNSNPPRFGIRYTVEGKDGKPFVSPQGYLQGDLLLSVSKTNAAMYELQLQSPSQMTPIPLFVSLTTDGKLNIITGTGLPAATQTPTLGEVMHDIPVLSSLVQKIAENCEYGSTGSGLKRAFNEFMEKIVSLASKQDEDTNVSPQDLMISAEVY